MPSDSTGLMIIRAWVEQGSSEPLRAHVRLTTDTSAGFDRSLTLVRVDEVCATVQEWLADVLLCQRIDMSTPTTSAIAISADEDPTPDKHHRHRQPLPDA